MGELNKGIITAYNKGYRVINNEVIYRNKRVKGNIGGGYKYINIRMDGKVIKVNIHRLVAYQKFGDEIFKPNICVRHLDSDSLNNYESNIGIGTQSDNSMDRNEKLRKEMAGNASRKHSYNEILEFYNKTKSYKETMNNFNISSKGTLHFILNNSMIVTS